MSRFIVPKHLEVPLGATLPAPVKEQPGMITGNWRTERPVTGDHSRLLLHRCRKGGSQGDLKVFRDNKS